jgi:acyl-CoA thioesterase II
MPETPSARLTELIGLLDLERIELNLFRAYHPRGRTGRLYGGQIMAQALRAAISTVPDDRAPHSLHGYFLRPGDPSVPALIDVERIRDGRSFTTRRVVVTQHGQAIFNMDASFQVAEPGFAHQAEMPPLSPPPERKIPRELRESAFIAWRHEHKTLKDDAPHVPQQHVWFRASGPLPDDAALHQSLLVYESDNALLSTARLPHRGKVARSRLQVASLDHAMWFHQPALRRLARRSVAAVRLDSPSASAVQPRADLHRQHHAGRARRAAAERRPGLRWGYRWRGQRRPLHRRLARPRRPSGSAPVPAGCQAGTRWRLPLPMRSARPMRFSASRSSGQLLASW